VVENLREASAFLLGRRTYEVFASYWPNASEEEQVLAEPLNTKPKYVASTTLTEPLDWQNSTLLQGDVADVVGQLRAEEGGDIHVIGSSRLVQTLVEKERQWAQGFRPSSRATTARRAGRTPDFGGTTPEPQRRRPGGLPSLQATAER
jgi:RibD C-terminal domain